MAIFEAAFPIAKYTGIAMRVALLTTFAASKKEPLAAMMKRVRQALLDSGGWGNQRFISTSATHCCPVSYRASTGC